MFDLDSSSVVRSLIGLFVFRCKPVVRSLIGIFVFRCKPVGGSVVRYLIGIFVFRRTSLSKVYQHRSRNGGILEVA